MENILKKLVEKYEIEDIEKYPTFKPEPIWIGRSEIYGKVLITEKCWLGFGNHSKQARQLFSKYEDIRTVIIEQVLIEKGSFLEWKHLKRKPNKIPFPKLNKVDISDLTYFGSISPSKLKKLSLMELARRRFENYFGPPVKLDSNSEQEYYQCHYCGEFILWFKITRDHKIPASKGGKRSKENILPACSTCNVRKGQMDYEKFIILIGKKVKEQNTD